MVLCVVGWGDGVLSSEERREKKVCGTRSMKSCVSVRRCWRYLHNVIHGQSGEQPTQHPVRIREGADGVGFDIVAVIPWHHDGVDLRLKGWGGRGEVEVSIMQNGWGVKRRREGECCVKLCVHMSVGVCERKQERKREKREMVRKTNKQTVRYRTLQCYDV